MSKYMYQCKSCGHNVSKNANVCPNCANQLNNRSRVVLSIVLVLFFPVVGPFICLFLRRDKVIAYAIINVLAAANTYLIINVRDFEGYVRVMRYINSNIHFMGEPWIAGIIFYVVLWMVSLIIAAISPKSQIKRVLKESVAGAYGSTAQQMPLPVQPYAQEIHVQQPYAQQTDSQQPYTPQNIDQDQQQYAQNPHIEKSNASQDNPPLSDDTQADDLHSEPTSEPAQTDEMKSDGHQPHV